VRPQQPIQLVNVHVQDLAVFGTAVGIGRPNSVTKGLGSDSRSPLYRIEDASLDRR
jgi:hypothetical protein